MAHGKNERFKTQGLALMLLRHTQIRTGNNRGNGCCSALIVGTQVPSSTICLCFDFIFRNAGRRCESPAGRAEDARLEAYACPDGKCSGICLPPQKGSQGGGGDGSSHAPLHQSSVASSREEEEQESGLSLSSLHPSLSDVAAEGETCDEGAAGCLTCRTCGPTSRRVEEARRHSKGVQELVQQGKALEERGEALAARQCLEQAVGRAEAWLHRGNWALSELYSHFASVCVKLQVREK